MRTKETISFGELINILNYNVYIFKNYDIIFKSILLIKTICNLI